MRDYFIGDTTVIPSNSRWVEFEAAVKMFGLVASRGVATPAPGRTRFSTKQSFSSFSIHAPLISHELLSNIEQSGEELLRRRWQAEADFPLVSQNILSAFTLVQINFSANSPIGVGE
jgi:hypothetical protein